MSACDDKTNQTTDKDKNGSLEKEIEGEKSTETITSQTSTRRFIPLPGAKSRVWKYFAFEADGDNKIQNNSIVFCQVPNCNARIGYSKNTTNMSLHLKRHHPTHYCEVK